MIPCAAAFTALSAPVNTPSNVEYTPEPWRRRNLFFGEVRALERALGRDAGAALAQDPKWRIA